MFIYSSLNHGQGGFIHILEEIAYHGHEVVELRVAGHMVRTEARIYKLKEDKRNQTRKSSCFQRHRMEKKLHVNTVYHS